MLAIGLASTFVGGFRWPPLLFVGFVLAMGLAAAWALSFHLSLTPTRIAQAHLFGGWRFLWSEIAAWRIVTDADGDRSLYFRAGQGGTVYAVNGTGSVHEFAEVERWFRLRCGDPRSDDDSLTPAWAEVPAPLRHGLRGLLIWWRRRR